MQSGLLIWLVAGPSRNIITQVLESMIDNPGLPVLKHLIVPMRSWTAPMRSCSGETSVGNFPVRTVQTIVCYSRDCARGLDRMPPRVLGGYSWWCHYSGSCEYRKILGYTFSGDFTQSGDSIDALRLRAATVYAFTFIYHEQCVVFVLGCHSEDRGFHGFYRQMTQQIDYELVKHGVAEIDDLVVMVAGSPPGVPGATICSKFTALGCARPWPTRWQRSALDSI